MSEQPLGDFLREVSNWDWKTFALAESDERFTTNEALIFAVIRACALEKLDAIKLATSRLDGLIPIPIKFEYPKVFVRYPRATLEAPPKKKTLPPPADAPTSITLTSPEPEPDIATLSFRQTVVKMSGYTRDLPRQVIELQHATERFVHKSEAEPPEFPRVKSVVAAHLLQLAGKRDISALSEVFDHIDGKLVQTIQLLGEDIYLNNYSATAPYDAKPGEDGVLVVEAPQLATAWAQKLSKETIR